MKRQGKRVHRRFAAVNGTDEKANDLLRRRQSGLDRFLNKVFNGDARRLLRELPDQSIDSIIVDAMYGTAKQVQYEWGEDPAKGDPGRHWEYHEPIYRECLRVLKPGGTLAWGQGGKFVRHFPQWFGGHRVWTLTRFADNALIAVGNIWMVQTREQQPIEFPHRHSLVMCDRSAYLPMRKLHPCPKPVEELLFMVNSLTQPGQIVLDCCCGLGSTLIAAQRLGRRWIGCDLSRRYCQIAMMRLGLPHSSHRPDAEREQSQRNVGLLDLHNGVTKDNDDWETPRWLFDQLDQEFQFDVDVCASAANRKCERFLSKADDALSCNWAEPGEAAYINPPYRAKQLREFVTRAYEQSQRGVTVVMLMPQRILDPRPSWAQTVGLIKAHAEIRMIQGYLLFPPGPAAQPTNPGVPLPQLVFLAIFRPDQSGFVGPQIDALRGAAWPDIA